MKKYLLLFMSAMMLTFGCYDDTDIRKELQEHENRISELETLCRQFNTNITALQTAVTALQNNVYVTSVAPVKSGSDVIGYVIVFNNAESITIYHGNDGTDGVDGSNGKDGKDGSDGKDGVDGSNGKDGKDGVSPVIGVRADADGVYYWTLNGEWLLSDGNKIQASGRDGANGAPGQDGINGTDGNNGVDGNTPKLKIVEGYWYVSYDGGLTWESESLGQATGDKGYTMFEEVTYDTDYVCITMAGGEKLTLPRTTTYVGGNVIGPATVTLAEVNALSAVFDVNLNLPEDELPYCKVTIYYSSAEVFSIASASSVSGPSSSVADAKNFSIELKYLLGDMEYNYCICVETIGGKIYSDIKEFRTLKSVPMTLTAAYPSGFDASFNDTPYYAHGSQGWTALDKLGVFVASKGGLQANLPYVPSEVCPLVDNPYMEGMKSYDDYNNPVVEAVALNAVDKEACFANGNLSVYAYTPYVEGAVDYTAVPMPDLSVQVPTHPVNGIFMPNPAYLFAYAKAEAGEEYTTAPVALGNMTPVYTQMTLVSPTFPDDMIGKKVTAITVSADVDIVAKNCTFNLETAEISGEWSKSVTLTLPEGGYEISSSYFGAAYDGTCYVVLNIDGAAGLKTVFTFTYVIDGVEYKISGKPEDAVSWGMKMATENNLNIMGLLDFTTAQ